MIEIRNIAGDLSATAKKISGVAIRYNTRSKSFIASGLKEKIDPEAFVRCLAGNPDIRCDNNHIEDQILGRTSAGTLQLRNSRDTLEFSCDLPRTSYAADLAENIRNGNCQQMSFGFNSDDDSFGYEPDDEDDEDYDTGEDRKQVMVRSVNRGKLYSVSPVISGAYGSATSLYARSTDVPQEVRSRALRFLNRSSDKDACAWIENYLSNRIPSHGLSSKDAQNVANGILSSYEIREDMRHARSNQLMKEERIRRNR